MRTKIENTFKLLLLHIRKPFQLTNVVEQGYAFYWTINLAFFYLPIEANTILTRSEFSKGSQAFILLSMALLSLYSIHHNVIWLRKLLLLINLSIILYYFVVVMLIVPIPAIAAYLAIMIYLSVFSFLRLNDE